MIMRFSACMLLVICFFVYFLCKDVIAAEHIADENVSSKSKVLSEDMISSQHSPEQEAMIAESARAYESGNYARAREIWEKLAADGDAQSMNNLGVLFDQGKGVEPDKGRALHWYAEAAKAGNPSGMTNYGRMLEQGIGIQANPPEAARWFDLAARKGLAEAQFNLGLMYERGVGVPKDLKAAAAWYTRAAAQHQADALSRLGMFYKNGSGVEKNEARAVLMLYAAAMNGDDRAIKGLEEMAKLGEAKPQAVLWGQKLDATDRDSLRVALKKAGAHVKRESDEFICDLYGAGVAVPGASQIAACYGPKSKSGKSHLGFMKIDYTAENQEKANRLVKMVEGRFGTPSSQEGADACLWNLGSVVIATQFVQNVKQMSLMYMIPRVYHLTRTH